MGQDAARGIISISKGYDGWDSHRLSVPYKQVHGTRSASDKLLGRGRRCGVAVSDTFLWPYLVVIACRDW
jgi:hypothetical protein